jgi:hypothetical protein
MPYGQNSPYPAATNLLGLMPIGYHLLPCEPQGLHSSFDFQVSTLQSSLDKQNPSLVNTSTTCDALAADKCLFGPHTSIALILGFL